MKRYALASAIALAAVLMLSDAASARIFYRPYVPVVVAPRAVVRTTYYPAAVPYGTAFVAPVAAPPVVVGPLGRVRYAVPYRPLVAAPVVVW
jgi:hypothetical protein